MATPPAPKAYWNNEEIQTMLNYLSQNKSQTEGVGSFKDTIWNGVAERIAPLLSRGPQKTSKMCQTKWTSLKRTYNSIASYTKVSGAHWDDDKGANIEGAAATKVWNDYVAKKPEMKPFMNKGWEYYPIMQDILFSTAARGSHVYRPALAPPASISQDEAIDGQSGTIVAAMDIDKDPTLYPTSVTSRGKRSHSEISLDTQANSLPTEITTPSMTSDPARKKQARHSATGPSQDSRDPRNKSSLPSNLTKVTPAVAMVAMQSQISRLTDVFEKSMTTPEDGMAAKRSLANSHIQQIDDGLSTDDKVKMIRKFQKFPDRAGTYLDLLDDDLRKAWLQLELESDD